jgi:hypothetical protein
MWTVGLILIERNTLGTIREVQRVHPVNADEENMLNLAVSLRDGRH